MKGLESRVGVNYRSRAGRDAPGEEVSWECPESPVSLLCLQPFLLPADHRDLRSAIFSVKARGGSLYLGGQGRPRLAELVWAPALPPADQGSASLDPYSQTLESGVSQEGPRGARVGFSFHGRHSLPADAGGPLLDSIWILPESHPHS